MHALILGLLRGLGYKLLDGNYGSKWPKRHCLYSNSSAIRCFDLGRLVRRATMNPAPKTCRRYVNKDGKTRYTGTKYLKKTEKPEAIWYMFMPLFCLLGLQTSPITASSGTVGKHLWPMCMTVYSGQQP